MTEVTPIVNNESADRKWNRPAAFTLIVAFICVALIGIALSPLLPVKLNPSRSLPGFTVRFNMPGTSARVVEMEATSKLEAMLARIKGIKKMHSTSGNGWGNITIELDKHADVDAVRFEASTIIRQTWSQLPDGVTYPYIQMKMPDEKSSRPFMTFTLNAPTSPILIQQFAEEQIKTRLAQIPGIYRVDASGATSIEWYNETLGSTNYKENIKPVVDKALGGTLRLFVEKVYNGSYFSRNEEVVLTVNANLPNGSTLEQMNTMIKRMEIFLGQYPEIKQFQTSIQSSRRASIYIYFTKESERNGFPYTLKSQVVSKALELGGGSWGVYGLQDTGFSNDVRENAGSFRIKMYGYNYDELYTYAEQLKSKLLGHRRIKEVLINSEFSWWKDDYQEFYFALNKRHMIQADINAMELFTTVRPVFGKDMDAGSVITGNGLEQIRLLSRQS